MADGPAGAGLLLAALAVVSDAPVAAGLAVGLAAAMRYHAALTLPIVALSFVDPGDSGAARHPSSVGGWGGVCDAPARPGKTGAFCPSHPDTRRFCRPTRRGRRAHLRGWRNAVACVLAGGVAGSALVAYNLAVYGTPTEPFTMHRGVFAAAFVVPHLAFYAAALLVIWPGMLLAPLLDRSRIRWLVRGVIVVFLGPLLFYYFHDRGDPLARDGRARPAAHPGGAAAVGGQLRGRGRRPGGAPRCGDGSGQGPSGG